MEDLKRAHIALGVCRGVLCDAESTLNNTFTRLCAEESTAPSSASPASTSVSGPSTSDLLAMLREKDEEISKLRKELRESKCGQKEAHPSPPLPLVSAVTVPGRPSLDPSVLAGAGHEEHTKEDLSWLVCNGLGEQDSCKARGMSWLPTLSNCGLDDHQESNAAAAQRVVMWLPSNTDSEHLQRAQETPTVMARLHFSMMPKLNPSEVLLSQLKQELAEARARESVIERERERERATFEESKSEMEEELYRAKSRLYEELARKKCNRDK